MPVPTDLRELVEELYEATRERRLKWKQTARDSEYVAVFSQSSVTVDCWIAEEDGSDLADLRVYNNEGSAVRTVVLRVGEEGFDTLVRLHSTVKESVTRAEETVRATIDELRRSKNVTSAVQQAVRAAGRASGPAPLGTVFNPTAAPGASQPSFNVPPPLRTPPQGKNPPPPPLGPSKQ